MSTSTTSRRTACRRARQANAQLRQLGAHQRGVPAGVHVRPDPDVILGGEPPVQRDLLGQEPDLGEERRVGPAARCPERKPCRRSGWPARRASAAAWSCPRRSARPARKPGPRAR